MKYNISTLTSTILLAIFLVGCNAPKPQKPIAPISKTITKTKKITSFTHAKKDKGGNKFTKKDILNAVILKYNKKITSRYGKSTITTKNPIFKIFYLKIFDINATIENMNIVTNFKTQTCEETHTMARTVNEKCKKVTTMKYYSNVKFVNKKNKWGVQISSVSKYKTHAPSNIEYFDKPEKLLVAVNKSLSAIKNISVSREVNIKFKGSIYSKYPIPAIRSSFNRSLKAYRGKKSRVDGYTNSYLVKINKKEYYIYINIFPYKTGNKVAYMLDALHDANKISKVKFKKKLDKLIKDKVTSIVNM